MISKTIINQEVSGKKWFQLLSGVITEADWRRGSVFYTGGIAGSMTQHTFLITEQPKAAYAFALTEKNARRIFHRRKLI